MSNKETYTYIGADGFIEAELLKERKQTCILARVQKWEVKTSRSLEEFYEIGKIYPTAILGRNAKITGTIVKALWDATLLRFAVGSTTPANMRSKIDERITNSFEIAGARRLPEFNISGGVRSEVENKVVFKVTVIGAKFAEWAISMSPNDYIIESCPFSGTGLIIEGDMRISTIKGSGAVE